MTYERSGLLLPKSEVSPIDAELLASFRSVHSDEIYKQLTLKGERKQQVMDDWHLGYDADLSASHLDRDELKDWLKSLREWKDDLRSRTDLDTDIQQVYRWRINEDIANVYMLEASASGDQERFRRWNKFIYGEPNEDIYRGALDWIASDAEALIADEEQHPNVVAAATHVLELLKDKRGNREVLAPKPETFEAVRNDHMRQGGYYALLLAGVEIPHTKIHRDIGDPILERVVHQNLESSYEIGDAAESSWGVSHAKEMVERPTKYNLPWQRFVGLGLGHEIGSHLLEKVNGARGPIGLAEVGLDRTEAGNEGRATIREQVMYETFDEFGKLVRWRDIMRRHIAISYGWGIGEERPQTSSEVYAFMNAIDTMYQAKLTPDEPEKTKEKARAKTDNLLARVLKGTDGKGGAYLKDKVYLEGHVASWLTAAIRGPQAISEGDLGKFDINNPRHILFLQWRGLLPANS